MKKEEIALEERKGLFRWIREHKKQLITAGVSIATLLAAIWAIKHRSQLKALWDELKALIQAPAQELAHKLPELTKKTAIVVPADAEAIVEIALEVPPSPIPDASEVISRSELVIQEHLRTLPEGWHPSPEKVAEAQTKGITLLENQTLVDTYRKGVVA